VILATDVDPEMLVAAYSYGTRGYFLDNPLPVAMLLAALTPVGLSRVLEHISRAESSDMTKVLTAHEQTLLALWNEGLSSSDIAGRLVLSNGTVKKELETIRKKLQKHNISGIMRKGRGKKGNGRIKKYVFERLSFMHCLCILVLVVQKRSLDECEIIICRGVDKCHYPLSSCLSGCCSAFSC